MSEPEVRTMRCRLRTWRDSDAERVLDIYRRWEVARWLGSDPKVMETLEQARSLVTRWSAVNRDQPLARRWAVERVADEVVAGTLILVPLPDGAAEFEVGWHLHPDSWGQGYATEAARAALGWAFERGLEEVFAVVRPDNDKSLAVCRRLGMAELGRTSRYYDAELELFRATPDLPTADSFKPADGHDT